MIHFSNCPVCNSDRPEYWIRTTDHFLSKEPFELWKCPECGFVFTQDHPDEAEIVRYYESEDYISHNDSSKGFSDTLYRLARRFLLRRKKRIVRKVTGLKTGSLLDIGSGTGHFLNIMKNGGWRVQGIEVNDKARAFSVTGFGLNVVPGEQISSLPSDNFDAVTLWHVLEHIQNPFTCMMEISRMLKPGGVCIVALPNCSSFDARYFREFWAAYDVPRHIWHFTPGTCRTFAEKAGFKVAGIKSLPIDVFYISILSEKYRKTRFYFVAGILKGMLFAFKSLFSQDRSSSLIYFLHRK